MQQRLLGEDLRAQLLDEGQVERLDSRTLDGGAADWLDTFKITSFNRKSIGAGRPYRGENSKTPE